MKVLLVPSPIFLDQTERDHMPLGLIYVGTALKNAGIDVEILDYSNFSPDMGLVGLATKITSRRPDVIGLSAMCSQHPLVLRLARLCKERSPDAVTVLGGPDPSLTAEKVVSRFPQIDLVVRGECEHTIARTMASINDKSALARIPGLVFRDGLGVVCTSDKPLVVDQKSIPMPDYGLLPSISTFGSSMKRSMCLSAGRGCPGRCSFCSLRGLRQGASFFLPLETIRTTLGMLIQDYGSQYFGFLNDDFTAKRSRVLELCRDIPERFLGIKWGCMARANHLDEELMKCMSRAGCTDIYVGMETGSQRMQRLINKDLDLEEALVTMRALIDRGLRYIASFIVGYPYEQLRDVADTLRYMARLRCLNRRGRAMIQLHVLSPLQGSPLYEKYGHTIQLDHIHPDTAMGLIEEEDWDLICGHSDIFSAYYHYPNEALDRQMLGRLPFLVENLLLLPYTVQTMLDDPPLGFPEHLLDPTVISLLDFDDGDIPRGNPTLEDQVKVCDFLGKVFQNNGLSHHPIHDIMKYDLAVRRVDTSESVDDSVYVESFSFDIQRWIGELEATGKSDLKGWQSTSPTQVLFSKTDYDYVETIPLPPELCL